MAVYEKNLLPAYTEWTKVNATVYNGTQLNLSKGGYAYWQFNTKDYSAGNYVFVSCENTTGKVFLHISYQDVEDNHWVTETIYIPNKGIALAALLPSAKTDKVIFRITSPYEVSTVKAMSVQLIEQAIRSVDIEYASGTSRTVAPSEGWQTHTPAWETGKYIWQRVATTFVDGHTEYSAPTLIQNIDSTGILEIEEQFYLSDSDQSPQSGSWSTQQPSWKSGYYIWTRSKITWMDSTVTYTDPVLAKALNDANEKADKVEKAIKTVDLQYAQNTSSTKAPTSGWQANPPKYESGKFIWQRLVTHYVNGDVDYSEPSLIQNISADTIKSIEEQYYLSTSKTTQSGGSWVTSQPTWSPNKYIWTRSKLTYESGTITYTDPVLATGLNDINEKTQKAIKSTDVEYASGTSKTSAPTTGWQTNPPAWVLGKWIWQRTTTTYVDGSSSTSPAVLIQNIDSLGIYTVEEQYYLSSSKTTQSGGSWSTAVPTWKSGKYIWVRSKIQWSDNTVTYSDPELASTLNDLYELQEATEKAIKVVDVQYAQNTSKTTAPTSGWQTNPPLYAAGKYIWQRTIIDFADGTTEISTPILIQNIDSLGIFEIVEQYYLSTSKTAQSGGSWSTVVPTWASGKYIWIRSKITWADNTVTYTTPELAKSINDLNEKTEKAIKGADIEYAQNSSKTTAPTSGWQTTPPTYVEGKYIWQRTKTTYLDGTTSYSPAVLLQNLDALGITKIEEQYYLSKSNTAQTNGSWSTTCPSWKSGYYLWSRSKVTWSDGSISYSDAVLSTSINELNEKTQKAIKTADVEYCKYTSGTSAPASTNTGWQTTPPTWEYGKYIWTRTKIAYVDGSTGYTTAQLIQNIDSNGFYEMVEEYYLSSSNTTQTGSSWKTVCPAWTSGKYLWSRTKITWTNKNVSYTDPVLLSSLNTLYSNTEKAVKSVDIQYILYTSKTSAPSATNSGWQTDPPVYTAGKYIWTRTVTTYVDGTTYKSAATLLQNIDSEGIKTIEEQYYLSSSSTTQTGGSWSTSQPTWTSGKYIWARSKITWVTGTVTYTDPVLAKSLTDANKNAQDAKDAVKKLDEDLSPDGVFNRLTDNGKRQGLYIDKATGNYYINATYIKSGIFTVTDSSGNIIFRADVTSKSVRMGGFTVVKDKLYYGSCTSLGNIASGTFMGNGGFTTGHGGGHITMANGQIYGGSSNNRSSGYVNFYNVWTSTNQDATRVAGQGGVFFLSPRIGRCSFVSSGSITVTLGQTKTVQIPNASTIYSTYFAYSLSRTYRSNVVANLSMTLSSSAGSASWSKVQVLQDLSWSTKAVGYSSIKFDNGLMVTS